MPPHESPDPVATTGVVRPKQLCLQTDRPTAVREAIHNCRNPLDRMARGEIVTACLATHTMPLDDGARGCAISKDKQDGNLRTVFVP